MDNYDFSETMGGAVSATNNILDTFRQADGFSGSNHNLRGIQAYASQKFDWFGENSDPCVACHNPHRAKRSKMHLNSAEYSSISLPSEHEELWGDDTE